MPLQQLGWPGGRGAGPGAETPGQRWGHLGPLAASLATAQQHILFHTVPCRAQAPDSGSRPPSPRPAEADCT